jgi:hypothetical protein
MSRSALVSLSFGRRRITGKLNEQWNKRGVNSLTEKSTITAQKIRSFACITQRLKKDLSGEQFLLCPPDRSSKVASQTLTPSQEIASTGTLATEKCPADLAGHVTGL